MFDFFEFLHGNDAFSHKNILRVKLKGVLHLKTSMKIRSKIFKITFTGKSDNILFQNIPKYSN